jgi:hypothetical protein
MKTYSGLLLAVLSLSLLTGCTDSMLTADDRAMLFEMRSYIQADSSKEEEEEEETVTYRMFRDMTLHSHTDLAKKAYKNGDNRLIALAMGYHASEKDATLFGVTCSEPVETIKVVFGCVPLPVVYFKMMLEYNKTLLEQSEFPHKDICNLDEKVFQRFSATDFKWADYVEE